MGGSHLVHRDRSANQEHLEGEAMIGLAVFGLIGIYALIVFGGLWLGVRHIPSVWVRIAVLLGFGVPLIALPVIDEIIGKYQFEKLCSQLEGVKDYEKVQLGREFYFEDGTPRWVARDNTLSESHRVREFNQNMMRVIRWMKPRDEYIAAAIKVTLHVQQVIAAETGSLLAEIRWFTNKGGWIGSKWGSPILSEQSCGRGPHIRDDKIYNSITAKDWESGT